jgi:predicted dehydrogenase
MKFLVAGLGSIGRRHFRNLRALGENDIILLRSHKATLPDDELASFPVETNVVAALRKHRPEAVIVANPTAMHLDVAIPAAEAGCHLLLEKPISGSLERVEQLESAVKRSGSRILVGFQFRFHPTLKKAAEIILSGSLGKVLTIHAYWGEYMPNWHPWEDYRQTYAAREDLGGGVIRTLTHPLDYVRWLAGEVTEVRALSGHISPLEMDVEDVAEIGLRFASGAIGGVHVNYVGTQGTLRWDNSDGFLTFHRTSQLFGTSSSNPPAPVVETFLPPDGFERNVMFLEQMKHFLAIARGEVEPICTLRDGVRAQELVMEARGKIV